MFFIVCFGIRSHAFLSLALCKCCALCCWQWAATVSLYRIHRLAFLMQARSVLREVRSESLLFTFLPAYLYQKDERILPGNLQSSIFEPPPPPLFRAFYCNPLPRLSLSLSLFSLSLSLSLLFAFKRLKWCKNCCDHMQVPTHINLLLAVFIKRTKFLLWTVCIGGDSAG
jgi:hypothetical protein